MKYFRSSSRGVSLSIWRFSTLKFGVLFLYALYTFIIAVLCALAYLILQYILWCSLPYNNIIKFICGSILEPNKWHQSPKLRSGLCCVNYGGEYEHHIKLTAANYSMWKPKMEDILYYKDLYDLMEKGRSKAR